MRAAPAALLASLLLTAGPIARAEPPRTVGVANLAADQAAAVGALEKLRAAAAKKGLTPLGPGPARAALEEPIDAGPFPAGEATSRAQALLDSGEAAAARFENEKALDLARQAESALLAGGVDQQILTSLPAVALQIGVLELELGHNEAALAAFRLVRRLEPARTKLDAGEYRPRAVSLYEQAGKDDGKAGRLAVTTDPPGAVVWVDGHDVGFAPWEGPAAAGDHYVGASLDLHSSRLDRVKVPAGGRRELSLILPLLPVEQRARALRAGTLRPGTTVDDLARAAGELAAIASVDALVVVRQRPDGGLEAAVYDAGSSKLGAFRDVGASDVLADLVSPATAAAAERAIPTGPAPEPTSGPSWYRTWWGITLVTVAVVGVAAGTYFIVRSQNGEGSYRIDSWCVADACPSQ